MTFDGTYARLQMTSAKAEMSGTYACQITNAHGKEESTAEVSITSTLFMYLAFIVHFLTFILNIHLQQARR